MLCNCDAGRGACPSSVALEATDVSAPRKALGIELPAHNSQEEQAERDDGIPNPLLQHLSSLLTAESSLPWGNRRDVWVGGSSWFFVLPVGAGGPATFFVQAVASFGADYVWTGLPCCVHLLDRWLASFHLVLVILTAAGALPGQVVAPVPWWGILLLLAAPLSCFMLSKCASKRGDFVSYRVWHTLWHLAAPVAIVYVYWRYCARPADRDTTLPLHCMLW